jgi:peptide/nickel transport system substrate-binding protein
MKTLRFPLLQLAVCQVFSLLIITALACAGTTDPADLSSSQQPAVPTSPPASANASQASATQPMGQPAVTRVPSGNAQATKRMTIAVPFAPVSNGAIETDDAFVLMRAGITEGLVQVDFDGEIKPYLAESWELTDKTTWEFKLREGVSFHNGEPFDSEAVLNAMEYLRSVPNPPRGFTQDTVASVEAVSSNTVVIRNGTPDPLLPTRMATTSTGILATSAYSSRGEGPPFPIGTGPFMVDGDISVESIRVVKNEDYRGGEINLDEALFLFVPDGTVRAGMLQTGEADFVSIVPITQLPLIEGNLEYTIYKEQQPRTTTLYVNNRRGPFSDVRVRKAAQYAIDRRAIVDAVLEGIGVPAIGPFAPSEAWVNTELKEYAFDSERSKSLLADAGYGAGELTVSLWTYPTRSEFPPMSVALQKMLNDGGFNTDVRIADYGAMAPDVFAGNFDMFLVSRGHLIDAYDPEGFFAADYSCDSMDVSNYSNHCNPVVDELLDEARPLSDPEERYEIYRQIQQILHDEAVTLFINYTEQIFAYNSRVQNWRSHFLEYYLLTPELDVVD